MAAWRVEASSSLVAAADAWRCDPCASAPSTNTIDSCRRASSARTCIEQGTLPCDWVLTLPKTLAAHWDERKARGWGNFWPYLKTYHYSAALLGRRLLLSHTNALPTEVVALGGTTSWRLDDADVDAYVREAVVVRDADIKRWAAANGRADASHTTAMLGYLRSLSHAPKVYLNVSDIFPIVKHALVSPSACHTGNPPPTGGAAVQQFHQCIGRLFSMPSYLTRAANDVARLRSRLPKEYTALHFRTFGADMHIPPGAATPDADGARRFLAWEVTANGSSISPELYVQGWAHFCANASAPVYVASDSRAALLMARKWCRSPVVSLGGVRMHAEPRSQQKGANRSLAHHSSVVDWLLLSYARHVVRVGAQHSTFVTTAHQAGCSVSVLRTPKWWRFKSASTWLLGKVRDGLRGVQKRAAAASAASGAAADAANRAAEPEQATGAGHDETRAACQTGIASMLRTTPCATPCLDTCRDAIYAAFA